MKDFQNTITERDEHKVVTTNTRLFVYQGDRCIGSSGCIRPKDFNFNALYKLAMQKSGEQIIKQVG